MAAINSNGTGGGNWSSASSWSGSVVPGDGDTVTIVAGDTIELDSDITVGNDTTTPAIEIYGTLKRTSSAVSRTLTCKGDISIKSGGKMEINMASHSDYSQTIIIDCATTDGKFGIIVDNGGKLDWDGAQKLYATQLNDADARAGDTKITVDGDITAWKTGDELVIEGDVAGETEKKTISSISGQEITLTSGLTYQHDDDRRVANISRNVKFTSANSSYKTYIKNSTTQTNDFDMQYIECSRITGVGSTDKAGAPAMQGGSSGKVQYCVYRDSAAGVSSYNPSSMSQKQRTISYNIFYNCSGGALTLRGCLKTIATFNQFYDCNNYSIILKTPVQPNINNNFACDGNSCFSISGAFYCIANGCISRTQSIADINISSSSAQQFIFFEDPIFESNTIVTGVPLYDIYFTAISRINGNDNDYRLYKKYGVIRSTGTGLADTFVRTAESLAMKMSPNDTSNALEWEFAIPCVADKPVAVTGYIYATEISDTEVTIELSGCGMTTDIYTCDSATNVDSWEQWVVSGTPTKKGLAKVKISCYKNASNSPDYYIDDIIVVSTQIDLGALDYWYQGLPSPIMLATGIGAVDIWKVFASIDFGSGSMGEKLKTIASDVDTIKAKLPTGIISDFDESVNQVIVATNNDKIGYQLADDAITASKFDESTAFPLKFADSGDTKIARTGADGDTLKNISDQLDTAQIDLTFLKNIEGGKWEIKNNQMIFYKSDNTTEICRFNLYDSNGNACDGLTTVPAKRERVS